MKFYNYLRVSRERYSPIYINNLLQAFSDLFDADNIDYVDYGKQDTRGSFSITIFYKSGCCSGVNYFRNSIELINYIEGIVQYKNKNIKGIKF